MITDVASLQIVAVVVEHMLTMNCTARDAVQTLIPHFPEKQKEEIITSATEQYILTMVKF